MSDDYDKIAELVRSGYDLDEALNQIEQTSVYVPDAASTTQAGIVEFATDAEVTTGTDTSRVPPVSSMVYHEGICKAWVNFNGTGTVAITGSYNVTSITDGGVGLYTVNFTTNMANANFAAVAACDATFSSQDIVQVDTQAVGTVAVSTRRGDNGVLVDNANISVVVFGDR